MTETGRVKSMLGSRFERRVGESDYPDPGAKDGWVEVKKGADGSVMKVLRVVRSRLLSVHLFTHVECTLQ